MITNGKSDGNRERKTYTELDRLDRARETFFILIAVWNYNDYDFDLFLWADGRLKKE